jgi:hypothetical protein
MNRDRIMATVDGFEEGVPSQGPEAESQRQKTIALQWIAIEIEPTTNSQ